VTRKHFNALAIALHTNKPIDFSLDTDTQWIGDVNAVADVCAASNTGFNRARFIDACISGVL